MAPAISIVVPVYNVEKYFSRCVQSIINQDYKDIEIILVDDGSTDHCAELCDSYAWLDKRIKVIHKQNGGLSDARNCGLMACNGKYVMFVDSDDYIEKSACSEFVKAIGDQKPDVVVGNGNRIENDRTIGIHHVLNTGGLVITGIQYLKEELKYGAMNMVWLNLYKREFLLDNGLSFKVGLLHEDEQFTPRVFLNAQKVMVTDIVFYNYVIREGSITTKQDKVKNAEDIIKTCRELENIYDKVPDKELKRRLNDSLVNLYLYIFQAAGLHRKEFSYLVDKSFLRGKAYTIRNKFRVALFLFNKSAYYYVNRFSKSLHRSVHGRLS